MTPFEWFIAFLMGGIATLVALFKTYYMPKEPDTEVEPNTPPVPESSPTEPLIPLRMRMLEEAGKWLGQDPSYKDTATDELGCADSLSNIINYVLPDFPAGIVSTINLTKELDKDKRFHRELTPHAGYIIVSPRIGEQAGHCGIFMSNETIASNTSKTGLFEINYSYSEWIESFQKKKGLRIFIWRPEDAV